MSEREKFLSEIEAFMRRHDMPKTVFGIKATGRLGFVDRIRAGGGVLMPTAEKVRAFMRNYKPTTARRKKKQSEARAS